MSDTWFQVDTQIFDAAIWVPSNPSGDAGIRLQGDIKELTARTKTLRADDGGNATPSISFRSDPDTGIYRVGANTIGMATAGILRVQVDSGGVNCVAPTQWSGFKVFTGANIVAELIGMTSSNDGGTLNLYSGGSSGLNARISADPGLHSFLRLPSGRRFGLGTDSPQRRLHIVGTDGPVATFPSAVGTSDFVVVENNGDANLCFVANTNNTSTIRFLKNGMMIERGSFSYDHANDVMKFTVAFSEAARFNSSGIFGVKTTSLIIDPKVPVQINAPSLGEVWYGANKNGGYGLLLGYVENTGAVIRQANTAQPLQFWTNDNVVAMTIDNEQRVGIGASQPLALAHFKNVDPKAISYQLLLQNQGSNSNAAGIAMQVTSESETSGLPLSRPKAGILFERNTAQGTGNLNFYLDGASDTNSFDATDRQMYLARQGGLVVGAPAGAPRTKGTVSAEAVYDDNTLLTDYVFDIAFGGGRDLLNEIETRMVNETVVSAEGNRSQQSVEKRFWKGTDVEVSEQDFEAFRSLPRSIKTLDEMESFVRENHHLPTIDGRSVWQTQGKPSVGKLLSQLYSTIEHLSLYIIELNGRLKTLEDHK